MQESRGTAFGPVGVDGLQPSQQLALMQAVAVRLGPCQLGLDAAQLCVAVEHEVDCRTLAVRGVLGDVGNLPAGRDRRLSGIGLEIPEQQREEGRFAAAVVADEPDLLTRIDGDVGTLDQEVWAAAQAE